MSSKSRGGLSKREYAAKQAKISAPKKTTSSKSSSSSSQWGFDPEAYTRDIYNALPASSPAKMSAAQHPGGFKEEEKKAKKAKSSPMPIVSTSQRSSALNAMGGGGSWATPKKTTSSPLRGYLDSGLDFIKNYVPGAGTISKGLNTFGVDLTDLLGIPNAEAKGMEFPVGENLQPEQVERAQGLVRGETYVPSDVDVTQPRTPSQVINLNQGPINYPNVSTPKRNPSPVKSPTPVQSDISSTILPQILNPQSQGTFTPDVQRENPTVQRLVGQGLFSKGQYANGAGNYGLEGAMTGTGGSIWEDLFGIPTANAQETLPNTMVNPTQWNQIMMGMAQANKEGGLNINSEPENQNYLIPEEQQPKPTNQNVGSTGGYSPAQTAEDNLDIQYAQQQEKALKAQEKAQKKAWKKLQKEIKAEFETQKMYGTQELDQDKQKQLMQLMSMFSVGGNADINDEQAMQYRQRAQQEAAANLQMYLDKLNAAKKKQLSGAEGNYEDAMSSIANQRQAAQYKLAKLLAQINKRKYANSVANDWGTEDDWDV